MRAAGVLLQIVTLTATLNGCGCGGDGPDGPVCGDGVCALSEGSDCADCTFEPGESVTATLTPEDYSTAEMEANLGIAVGDVQAALAAAGKTGAWDFAGFGSVWVGGWFASDGTSLARVASADGGHDYCMACRPPDGGPVRADDEEDDLPCTPGGDCDAAVPLDQAGIWTCVFAATPDPATNPDPYGTLTVSAE